MTHALALLAMLGMGGCACTGFRPVRGTIVDQTGVPIGGALVSSTEYYEGTIRSTSSDAGGEFHLTRDDVTGQDAKHGGEACPSGVLAVSAAGCTAATFEFDVRGDDELDLRDVVLSCTK